MRSARYGRRCARRVRALWFSVLVLSGILLSTAAPAGEPKALDQAAIELARVTEAPVRLYSTRDFGRERYAGARSVLLRPAESEMQTLVRAYQLLLILRRDLPPGIIAFVGTTRSLTEPPAEGVEIVVAEGHDQFDILRVAATDAVNYDMDTEAVIRELEAWDREIGIDIWLAETDRVQMDIKTLPGDVPAFARRVYRFCPDIVDQADGSVEALAREIARDQVVGLWWD
ncbi:MAG: DUF4253 domain-containing protein [Dehalococcoidia bacterium]